MAKCDTRGRSRSSTTCHHPMRSRRARCGSPGLARPAGRVAFQPHVHGTRDLIDDFGRDSQVRCVIVTEVLCRGRGAIANADGSSNCRLCAAAGPRAGFRRGRARTAAALRRHRGRAVGHMGAGSTEPSRRLPEARREERRAGRNSRRQAELRTRVSNERCRAHLLSVGGKAESGFARASRIVVLPACAADGKSPGQVGRTRQAICSCGRRHRGALIPVNGILMHSSESGDDRGYAEAVVACARLGRQGRDGMPLGPPFLRRHPGNVGGAHCMNAGAGGRRTGSCRDTERSIVSELRHRRQPGVRYATAA